MRNSRLELVLWLGAYVVLVGLPLGVAAAGDVPPGRGLWLEFAVGLGFVGFAMMALQFALTARFRWIAPTFGLDTLLQFHRQAAIVSLVMVLTHPLILFVVEPEYLEYLNPLSSFVRAAALWAVLGALLVLVGSAIWRPQLHLRYEWWRTSHAVLSTFVVFVGTVHMFRVGYYMSEPWKQAAVLGMTTAAVGLLAYTRGIRPLRLRRTPYRVVEVVPEPGKSWTVVVEPAGHAGLRFEPGQFAWVTFDANPFSPEQHPFSFSSSADSRQIAFTIKALGDFSSRAGDIPPGTPVYIDGPYGSFTVDAGAAEGAVFVAGGVGITPIMSILRTLRDREDERPFTLVYAAGAFETMVFREELEEMPSLLNLRLVLVPREPPPQWTGEHGNPTPALLERVLPTDESNRLRYLVCGPPGLMDLTETFLRERGTPGRHINAERFDIA
jgi:predicted ferric reductase